jgi:hypothetical protein
LADLGDGLYVGTVPSPKEGWTAYFVEMTFSGPDTYPYKFTTEVGVTPDRLPFGPPPEIESWHDKAHAYKRAINGVTSAVRLSLCITKW